ncbi:MAG TPA: GtrA family protein [Burkholderiales bacterium]|nr:GtrA family protein [Burkholderiales bacterium]
MVIGRFFSVGLVCALLHNAIMIGGDWFGLHYAVSSLISFAIVVLVGYGLHSSWTFPGARRGATSFTLYTVTMALNLPLSLAGMFMFVDLAGLGVPLAAPAVTAMLAAFNFVGGRWALRARRA